MDHLKRDLKRCIYTSSYDRGLQHLLELWPVVKKSVPEATLHCFYGWQLFDQFYSTNPASMQWKAHMVELMRQDRVTDHGRVSQPELVTEYEKSGLWVYPTHFGEINCISALKAQAYGCEPVVVNYAALKETVKFGHKVEGDIYDKETQEVFQKELISALLKPCSDEKRLEMQKWAIDTYSWTKIAKDWDTELRMVPKGEIL